MVLERPFYLPEVYKLDYDPREVLEQILKDEEALFVPSTTGGRA
jgi:hypothetical protein